MRPGLRRALLLPLALILLALLAEGALRLMFRAARSATMPKAEIQEHLGQGYAYDPDLSWYWSVLPDDGAKVNADGFRRVAPMTRTPSPGILRVITVGDSQTFGGGVAHDQTFSHFAQEALGDRWEILNAGISGYRSLNVYRLLRLRLLAYEPQVLVVDCMPKDSPREDGPLTGKPLAAGRVPEWLWNSRLYYFSQLSLRLVGLRPWETLPWPLQLHEIRERLDDPSKGDLRNSPDMGNHDLIARFGAQHGMVSVFMRYPFNKDGTTVGCHTWDGSMPEGAPLFDACAALEASGLPARELFLDTNHLSVKGNQVVGAALAARLMELHAAGALPPARP